MLRPAWIHRHPGQPCLQKRPACNTQMSRSALSVEETSLDYTDVQLSLVYRRDQPGLHRCPGQPYPWKRPAWNTQMSRSALSVEEASLDTQTSRPALSIEVRCCLNRRVLCTPLALHIGSVSHSSLSQKDTDQPFALFHASLALPGLENIQAVWSFSGFCKK